MGLRNKFQSISNSWIFLVVVLIFYLIVLIVDVSLFQSCLDFFYKIFIKIFPIFIIVFILMVITNYFITPEFILKHTREKGIKKWFFIIVGGILSAGPVYMWYPLLADLEKKGLSYGLIACFLYNRAIKIPLIPLMILYFSVPYIIVLSLVMIFVSVVQGVLIDRVMSLSVNLDEKGGKK